ncbi:16S rRNA m(2)G 1207 methyltransferase [Loktanella fryxellensis]|uniref:16S rRNA m(2)G 1207 methyltransferase n=1 Tax=Loktanella fryxellensis TaxID=245187 RepID=A0A1H8AXR5_9RHOB|nr:methyltransferase [Loktanella fryxellensis]SEM74578.1 16S rRNA m(2)G 1207 methyltransferase [Loktanella fryxellensis]
MAATSRLQTVIDDGLLTLPAGPVTVMRPTADYDLSPLAGHEIRIAQGFAPDAAAFAQAGFAVTQVATAAPTMIVVVPRSKALARSMIAQACAGAELVIVDGQRTDGIDSLLRDVRAVLGEVPSLPKAKGRLFWFAATPAFADWAAPAPVQGDHGFYTTAGVFSDGAVDRGSALLAAALPEKLPARMGDLGAGWGYLAHAVLACDGVKSLDLIEAEALSLDCARLNVTDPRATFHWADALTHTVKPKWDGIVMNPPFHTGSKGTPALGQGFIAAASRLLAPHGKLWMVANRHLPYEAALRERFRNVGELPGDGAYKLFHATRPIAG